MQSIFAAITAGGSGILPLAFLAGLLTSLHPCTWPFMAAVAGYIWAHGVLSLGRRAQIGAAFVVGHALTYAALGTIGGLTGSLLGLSRHTSFMLVGGVCILAGLFMAEVLVVNLSAPSPLPSLWLRLRGLPGALLLGLLFGLAATPCASYPLLVVLAVAAAQRVALVGALLLFVYALGHALPAAAFGVLGGSLSGLDRLAPYGRGLQIAGGWLIIIVGFYLIMVA